MKKKGFTLIELLAVLVVIVIILVIAVPKVNEVINNSRKESFYNNVLNMFEAVKKLESTSGYQLNAEGIKYNDKRLNITNNPFTGGKIYLNKENEAESDNLTDDRFCAIGTKKELVVLEGDCEMAKVLSNITYTQLPSKQAWYRGKQITISIKNFEQYPFDFSFSVDGGSTFHKISKEKTPLIFGNYNGTHSKDFYKEKYNQQFEKDINNGNIIVRIEYKGDMVSSAYKVTMVDSTAPENVSVRMIKRNTNRMYVLASAIEEESYIKSYEFKIDDGNYVNNGQEPSFRFDNVKTGSHKVSVRVTNAVGDSSEVTREFKPETLVAPEIIVKPADDIWQKSKTVTIKYPMNREDVTESLQNTYVYTYKKFGIDAQGSEASTDPVIVPPSTCKIEIDNLDNRYCVKELPVLTKSSIVMATVSTGTNEATQVATVNKIDSIRPEIKNISTYVTDTEIRLHVSASDETGGSGIVSPYECSKDGGTTWTSSTGTMCKFSGLNKNTKYNLRVKVKDNAGNEAVGERSLETLSEDYKIKLEELKDGIYKKVKINFPNMGDSVIYRYKVGDDEWKTTTDLEVTTRQITVNNTAVLAEVYYEGNTYLHTGITVNIDITPPVCTWSAPSGTTENGYIKNGQYLTYTFTCTDDYGKFSDNIITTANIASSNTNVATISSVSSPTSVTDGFKYTVMAKAGSTTGSATFTLVANSVADAVGNKNVKSAASSALNTDNEAPTCGSPSWSPSSATTGSVQVTIGCSDSKSGCSSNGTETYKSNCTSGCSLTISDRLGNTRTCSGYTVTNIYSFSIEWEKKNSTKSCFNRTPGHELLGTISSSHPATLREGCYTGEGWWCHSNSDGYGYGDVCMWSNSWSIYRGDWQMYSKGCISVIKPNDKCIDHYA